MDTGLGNKAYSIIGQGKIGAILEQRPEETRVMLEEAAGITKYRKKVAASQRKIELTETNLQRVEDILGELQRQIRSLKRQASKAKRYKTICEKIKNLELTIYTNTYNQLLDESGNKLKSTDELVQQEIGKSTKLSQLQARIETINLELDEKDSDLSKYRKNHLHLSDMAHKKEAGLESLSGEIRMQGELEVRLKDEGEEIRKRLAGLDKEKAGLEKEIDEMKKKAGDLEMEITLKEKRIKSRRDLLKTIKEGYEKAREKLNAGINRDVGLSHESGYLNKMLNQITDGQSRLEKELGDVKEKIENLLKASEIKRRAREATADRLKEIEDSIEEQNICFEELKDTKDSVETELKSVESDLNMCQSRLASLKALTENYEGYKIGVRTIMKAEDLDPRKRGRILGLVADVIQVDPRYEQAVEAVLADKLQYIIVKSQEDGKQAIDYLKERAKGRGSFVPLKDLKGNGNGQIKKLQFSLLSDMVTVEETYRPLINSFLGDTMLVEDLDKAISAWRGMANASDQNVSGLCFVTTDGDMVDERGVVSGGRLAQNSRGLLARKREIAELEKKSSDYLKRVDDLRHNLKEAVTEIEHKKKVIEDLTEDKWTCHEEVNEFDKILFRFGQELDQFDKLSEKISEDLKRKDREQDRHKQELLKIEEELHQRDLQRQKEEVFFQQKELELKESEEEFDRFRDELAKLKADYRIIKEEQRGLVRDTERMEDYADESLNRFKKIEEDISLGHKRCDVCREKKEALKDELRELYEKLKRAEEEVTRTERQRQVFQDKIREEEKKTEYVREEIASMKEKINRARMEHSEITFKMNSLSDLVKEKFNLNLHDVYGQYLDESFSTKDAEENLEHQKVLRNRLGEVNLTAIKEHDALKERYEFIKNQREDLIGSIESLRVAIKKINKTSREKFKTTFQDVNRKIKEIFPILFKGGTAGLKLTDETNPLESGVLVEVQPPGKKLSHMGLLSGGEKALVAMAFIFAIYLIKPSPFCMLDEVDAPLDEANIDRFNILLNEIKKASQVIMVTHNRRAMEIADYLYGITMENLGVSKIVSVDLQSVRDKATENTQEKI